ncbi:MAG TPA: hypothetical protein PLF72_11930 [Anaerolineaceae bacterium]|nr:hypothetical protein [Anaerolineaceae bacterium]
MAHQTQMNTINGVSPFLDPDSLQIKNLAATLNTVSKAASYTVLVTDSGTVFDTTGATGAVTFTLPTVTDADGCFYMFVNTVNQNMVITSSPADKMVYDNDAAADSLTASTASHKIGAAIIVVSDGANWLAWCAGNGSAAFTAAT